MRNGGRLGRDEWNGLDHELSSRGFDERPPGGALCCQSKLTCVTVHVSLLRPLSQRVSSRVSTTRRCVRGPVSSCCCRSAAEGSSLSTVQLPERRTTSVSASGQLTRISPLCVASFFVCLRYYRRFIKLWEDCRADFCNASAMPSFQPYPSARVWSCNCWRTRLECLGDDTPNQRLKSR
jgi:hypothetical protein